MDAAITIYSWGFSKYPGTWPYAVASPVINYIDFLATTCCIPLWGIFDLC
jgi:hypothetical protein